MKRFLTLNIVACSSQRSITKKQKSDFFLFFLTFTSKHSKLYFSNLKVFSIEVSIMDNSNRSFKSWRLKQRPSGEIETTDLELVDDIIPEIK